MVDRAGGVWTRLRAGWSGLSGSTTQLNLGFSRAPTGPGGDSAVRTRPGTICVDAGGGRDQHQCVERINDAYRSGFSDLVRRLALASEGRLLTIQVDSEAENTWRGANPTASGVAAGYADAVCLAAEGLRAAKAEDQRLAGARVVALGWNPADLIANYPEIAESTGKVVFLKDFLAQTAALEQTRGRCFDALGVHLSRAPETVPATVEFISKQIRSQLGADSGRAIWSDDTASGPVFNSDDPRAEGLASGDQSAIAAYEREQVINLTRKSMLAWSSGVGRVYASSALDQQIYDPVTAPSLVFWNHQGLLDMDGSVKPSYEAWAELAKQVRGSTSITRRTKRSYVIDRGPGRRRTVVAWSDRGTRRANFSDILNGRLVSIQRMAGSAGQELPAPGRAKTRRVKVGVVPVIVNGRGSGKS
ncbi:MAG: hypothetical protein WBW62_04680 [Solirubrobacterales bacterium]